MPELDRRDFLKLVGLGAGTAAAVGCMPDPIENLVPYVVQPEDVTPGLPTFYASTCRECEAACGLHVRTREGRPIKLEGNPDHPVNRGKLCARGQAGIGRTYHPDRHTGAMSGSGEAQASATWDAVQARLAAAVKAAPAGTWILGASRGPTIDGIIDGVVAAAGLGGRVVYSAFDGSALRAATAAVFGVAATPLFDMSSADLILDFGSDFLGTGVSPVEHAGQFAAARDISTHKDGGARLVTVGPRMTLTGSNAEQWIPAAAGSEGAIALALAKAVAAKKGINDATIDAATAKGASLSAAAAAADVDAGALDALADAIVHARAAVALPPGPAASGTNAVGTSAAVLLLNAVVGAVGTRVRIPAEADPAPAASYAEVQKLVDAMNAGQVTTLIVNDANPLYSLPAGSGFAAALAKVGTVVSLSSLADETSRAAQLVLPDHTPLESWGDAEARRGVRSLVQPTIRPLHDTRAIGDVFLELGRALGAPVAEADTRSILEANWGGAGALRQALSKGGSFATSPAGGAVVAASAASALGAASQLAGRGDFTLVAYPHSYIGDGSGAALPWMQELPDPVTKLSWNSWAEVSKNVAAKLDVKFGDIVKVETESGSIELPVYPRGGVRDDVVAIAVGQGHTVGWYASREIDLMPGVARGASVISVMPAAIDENGGRAWLASKAGVSKTGAFQRVPLSQWTDNQRGRGLAPEVTLAKLAGHEEQHAGGAHHDLDRPYEPKNDAHPENPYRWGMTIDNDLCNGCSACIAACYVENNISIVGETNAIKHRELTWIRIERYIGDGDREGGEERRPTPDREELGKTGVRHVPMLCQHCGAAPCESVCPVLATYHTTDGMNGMVYNRCVGTRYCANNCVYKVRRFNYFDYGNQNWPGLLSLMLNPDVTVRQQGVMEKCSFCVQRVQLAKQPRKDVGQILQDGDVVTACQQSCPTSAITFGNTREAGAALNKKAAAGDKRAYHALHSLNVRPAITYLAQLKRDGEESHA